jgi:hypothetical protein
MTTPLTIEYVDAAREARRWRDQGYCPIECAFGEESVVDDLQMDHHGTMSGLEGVAIRACRDHYGARKADPRFVVTGAADADATLAIACLAGLLLPTQPTGPSTRPAVGFQAFLPLAELVSRADVDPIGLRLEESENGRRVLLFKRLASGAQDATAFHAGVDCWRLLCGSRTPRALLAAVAEEEALRVKQARAAAVECLGDAVALVESEVWGYDVWYAEIRPVIVAFIAAQNRVSIGCRDLATAARFFGPAGLGNVFPKLQPPGWGGRETIGGSPRGARLTREEAHAIAQQVAALAASQNSITSG